jgi:hypothetical protein
VPQQGARLSPEWMRFRDRLDKPTRSRLYSLIRYCSARGIGPSAVDDKTFDNYWRYRAETTGRACNNTARRFMVRAWNACAVQSMAGSCGGSLSRPSKSPSPPGTPSRRACAETCRRLFRGPRQAPPQPQRQAHSAVQPTTIRYRRAELVAMARMAVRLGVPIESLTSLAALLHPDVAKRSSMHIGKRTATSRTPAPSTSARKCCAWPARRRLPGPSRTRPSRRDEGGAGTASPRGLTPKNLQLIRQVLTDGVWSEVVSLPNVLMQQARLAKDHAPIKAAVSAQLAVAVAILTFAPVRLSNLVSIELGQNLIKPGGLNTPYWLVFPHYDVKNRVDLNFKFDQPLTDLIDEYIHEFRPALLRGTNASWLFPGEGGQPKNKLLFSKQIT